jgi:CMP/dCMP kinase
MGRKGDADMPIVTISGNIASGATEIGRLVAHRLSFDYVDREILTEAARTLGVSETAVAGRDDRSPPPHFRDRLATFFQNFLEHSAFAGVDPYTGVGGLETLMSATYREAAALPEGSREELTDNRYKDAICSIITQLAARGDVVIIGRGSQAMLKDQPRTLHVAVTAPFAVRAERIAARDHLPSEKAKQYVEESDRGRLDFHRRYFKIDPSDTNLYDLVINTARVCEEDAAQLVVTACRQIASE